ncbi:MAG: VWA domain-containing protein [Rhodobacteraceae bacterium]|nr:VWA domain-containing protein [Paracoccaceae bacterium]
MSIRPLDLMEPEETVGKLWHDYATGVGASVEHVETSALLGEVMPSLVLMYRALGGGENVELGESALTVSPHRLSMKRKLGTQQERLHHPRFDGERLRLPPQITRFETSRLNRTLYLWLAALAAHSETRARPRDALQADVVQLALARDAMALTLSACPGLRWFHRDACAALLQTRKRPMLPKYETAIEAVACHLLGAPCPEGTTAAAILRAMDDAGSLANLTAPLTYLPFSPVELWLAIDTPRGGNSDSRLDEDSKTATAPETAGKTRKTASRENREEANRSDSFILHRFEAILSWVESMNLNRDIDDDDDKEAQKAADDQDHIALSRHDRKLATKLRLHLDLSPDDAEHERLAGKYTYPEWNHRSRSYLPDHCRVLDAWADTDAPFPLIPDPKRMREVRRQFEALRPRRILRPRQVEGTELDLDALIAAQIDIRATGQGSDRIYQSHRQVERDLSVAFLLDTSRSTESAVGDTCVIDVAREALAALAGGIDASGDRLGIWGFSSLKHDRVFLNRCKGFDDPMTPDVTNRICGLRPCHYTRLGTAIRHMTAMLVEEQSARKLMLVLTDGKPNDLDHYEGVHGIEDSHMAVREARRHGHTVHGIIIDQDGQDWFTRIFGRGGFTLLPNPARLSRALPDIYRSLIQET